MVGVDGVEPPMFTTRERIYSPLQNTPYLQHTRNGSLGKDRTPDKLIKSQLLYRLSYQTVFT